VQVAHASLPLRQKVERFHRNYAANTAIALVAGDGGAWFAGPGLEELDDLMRPGYDRGKLVRPRKASDLFSDLNQWLLKVLLASELPVHLLNAPRASYRHGSALAEAARVSVMGASRFLRRMREEGFLENSAQAFRVVRCGELFRRWHSADRSNWKAVPLSRQRRPSYRRQLRQAGKARNRTISTSPTTQR
jgi:hypothetical protein